MACAEEVVLAEIVQYKCGVHEKDLMSLLCKDCERPVCLDCLNTDHAGHKMCKLSEFTDNEIDQLNNIVQMNNSACFDLKKIGENLQKRRQEVKKHVEEMVQRVIVRKEEIVKEAKDVGQQKIEQIKNLATDFENIMVRDEQDLNSFMSCNLFRKESDEDCIKCFYFYKKLEMLDQKYGSGYQEGVPFSLVTREFPTDKIFELVGSIVTDEQSSSDENLEQKCDTQTNPNETNNVCKSDIKLNQNKKKFTDDAIDSIISVSDDRSILRCNDVLYHQSNTDVEKLVDKIEHVTYVPETDEILLMLKGEKKNYRKPISPKGQDLLVFMDIVKLREVICMGHDASAYLVVLFTRVLGGEIDYSITSKDDVGRTISFNSELKSSNVINGRYKLHKSSFLIMDTDVVHATKGLDFEILFSYRGKKGNTMFHPADICTDSDSNYLVVDSFDDTVHLLDPKGNFLKFIMSAEDGPSGMRCIAMYVPESESESLCIGCKDGMVHFMNYQYFKSTTRKERCLQRQKKAKLETL